MTAFLLSCRVALKIYHYTTSKITDLYLSKYCTRVGWIVSINRNVMVNCRKTLRCKFYGVYILYVCVYFIAHISFQTYHGNKTNSVYLMFTRVKVWRWSPHDPILFVLLRYIVHVRVNFTATRITCSISVTIV